MLLPAPSRVSRAHDEHVHRLLAGSLDNGPFSGRFDQLVGRGRATWRLPLR